VWVNADVVARCGHRYRYVEVVVAAAAAYAECLATNWAATPTARLPAPPSPVVIVGGN